MENKIMAKTDNGLIKLGYKNAIEERCSISECFSLRSLIVYKTFNLIVMHSHIIILFILLYEN